MEVWLLTLAEKKNYVPWIFLVKQMEDDLHFLKTSFNKTIWVEEDLTQLYEIIKFFQNCFKILLANHFIVGNQLCLI